MTKNMVIIGAGPGLGLALAKEFGRHDFKVALVARHQTTLDRLSTELRTVDVPHRTYVADVTDPDALTTALRQIIADFKTISVVEFSPYAGPQDFRNVLTMTPEDVQQQLTVNVLPAVQVVRTLLPTLQRSPQPGLLFNSGISARHPLAMLGNTGIAAAGLRNYALNLAQVLAPEHVYVGFLAVATQIKPATVGDPALIARQWYEMYAGQISGEAVFPSQQEAAQ